jgi:hypothetical protein
MKLTHKFMLIALICQWSSVFAASCEDNFKTQGDPSGGVEYFASTLVSGVSVASAMEQLQAIATADGFKVHDDKSNIKEGKLIIEQVKGSRPFLILIAGLDKGTASALFIQTRLNLGASAKAQDMRQAMCGMLARVKSAAEPAKAILLAAAGKSTIKGTVFAKAALLTPRQYPPKGSTVEIILLNDDVKRWMETANRARGNRYPEEFEKLVAYTTIEDDQGGFKFNNLAPGEYVLYTSLTYFRNRSYQQYEGTDAVIDHRSGAVVANNDRYSQRTFSEAQGANVQKNVVIKNDGDTVEVELSKSNIFSF